MGKFDIRAGSVQNMVTGENVDIQNISATQETGTAEVIAKLTELLERQIVSLAQQQRQLSQEDLTAITAIVQECLAKIKEEPNAERKQATVSGMVEKIRGALGPLSDVLSTVFKLAGVFGLT